MRRLEREIALKASFPSLKTGQRGFITDSLTEVLLIPSKAGLRALWLSIIIGDGYVDIRLEVLIMRFQLNEISEDLKGRDLEDLSGC